jgi:hypothetical protein
MHALAESVFRLPIVDRKIAVAVAVPPDFQPEPAGEDGGGQW